MRVGRGALAELRKEALRDPARRCLMRMLWAALDGSDEAAAKWAVIAWLLWPHVTHAYDYFDHFEFQRIEQQQGRGFKTYTLRVRKL
jgi:hypothetical protein